MTLPGDSYSLVGELVRDYWRYEHDVLELDGHDVAGFILEHVETVRIVPDNIIPDSAQKTYFGRVRLTLQVLGPGCGRCIYCQHGERCPWWPDGPPVSNLDKGDS